MFYICEIILHIPLGKVNEMNSPLNLFNQKLFLTLVSFTLYRDMSVISHKCSSQVSSKI